MFEDFLAELGRYVPGHARIMSCQFRGDPADDTSGKWKARVVRRVDQIDDRANVYLCVSAMQQNGRGEFRRRRENFAGGLCLMIDDLGCGSGSKFPLETIAPLPPTALVETSPKNYQAIYMFDSLVESITEFDALIRAFIAKEFLAHDPGMAGVNRVFRPPIGVNGKAKYGGWICRLEAWRPQARYSMQQIADAFDLKLQREVARKPIGSQKLIGQRTEAFQDIRRSLRQADMLKGETYDMGGWQQITCPWVDGHTDAADNGAAIREPSQENEWYGAFRCHHGSCMGKGWRDLTDWLLEEQWPLMEAINGAAPKRWRGFT